MLTVWGGVVQRHWREEIQYLLQYSAPRLTPGSGDVSGCAELVEGVRPVRLLVTEWLLAAAVVARGELLRRPSPATPVQCRSAF